MQKNRHYLPPSHSLSSDQKTVSPQRARPLQLNFKRETENEHKTFSVLFVANKCHCWLDYYMWDTLVILSRVSVESWTFRWTWSSNVVVNFTFTRLLQPHYSFAQSHVPRGRSTVTAGRLHCALSLSLTQTLSLSNWHSLTLPLSSLLLLKALLFIFFLYFSKPNAHTLANTLTWNTRSLMHKHTLFTNVHTHIESLISAPFFCLFGPLPWLQRSLGGRSFHN